MGEDAPDGARYEQLDAAGSVEDAFDIDSEDRIRNAWIGNEIYSYSYTTDSQLGGQSYGVLYGEIFEIAHLYDSFGNLIESIHSSRMIRGFDLDGRDVYDYGCW